MTRLEKLNRDLETLRDSLSLDAEELKSASPEQRTAIRQHMRWCVDEMTKLMGVFRTRENLNCGDRRIADKR
jgi:ABC-type iron transport system FetAB permease component